MKALTSKEITRVGLFTALTAVGAFIPAIPIGPVPITLQTLFTALAGTIMGARLGMWSQIIYVLLGIIGLPIFSGFKGGASSILMPSFGYLIGFILGTYVTGLYIQNRKNKNFINIFISVLLGYAVIYLVGLPYMYIILNKVMRAPISMIMAIKTGLLVFIPGDLIKAIIVSIMVNKIFSKVNFKIEN
ncbi:biotin transporter BioY [Clostridium niameyense]|uniref:Biotin transporter n=1 Tax=Clostridium niameyense TaxID=1622073 RepID=A0A6M0R8A1_9CLOT|nr:biotin transporter BioY [Clostridium niameyense]NEZ46446.1 biotin transporter BioY [Clostridium niameyense]